MEHMQGRQEDQNPEAEAPDERDVERSPGDAPTGSGAGGGTTAPETETGGLGGIGAEGVPTADQRWPEDAPGTSGGSGDEPSGRVGP